jgi:hypothetical protein
LFYMVRWGGGGGIWSGLKDGNVHGDGNGEGRNEEAGVE